MGLPAGSADYHGNWVFPDEVFHVGHSVLLQQVIFKPEVGHFSEKVGHSPPIRLL